MKRPAEIFLMVRDAPVKLSHSGVWFGIGSSVTTFDVLRFKSKWSSDARGYVCPVVLDDKLGWNVILSTLDP